MAKGNNYMNEYAQQAKKFLAETNTTIEIAKAAFQGSPTWAKNEKHGIQYFVELKNAKGSFVFPFWDSIANAHGRKKPNPYDILSCMSGNEPEADYYEFCKEFGYEPSREIEETHKAVLKEWQNLNRLFTPEELEKLSEIN